MTIQKNNLHYYVDLIRNNRQNECGCALNSIIHTMRLCRNNFICREDFSNLDFGYLPLNGIFFSLNGESPCSFRGSLFSEWNFRKSGHFDRVIHAKFSRDSRFLITWGKDARIIVWNIESRLPCFEYESSYQYNASGDTPDYDIPFESYELPKEVNEFLDENLGKTEQITVMTQEQVSELIDLFEYINREIFEDSYMQKNDIKLTSYNNVHAVLRGDHYYDKYLIEIKTAKIIYPFLNYSSGEITLSPDDNYFCTCEMYSSSILYSMNPIKELHRIKTYFSNVVSISSSADYKYCCSIAMGSDDVRSTCILWNLEEDKIQESNAQYASFLDLPQNIKWKEDVEITEVEEWTDDECDMHRRTFYRTQNDRYTIKTYQDGFGRCNSFSCVNNKTKKENIVTSPNYGSILCGAISENDIYFVFLMDSSLVNDEPKPYSIGFYNMENGEEKTIDLELQKNTYITASTFSLYAKHLFVGMNDGTIYVFDSATGNKLKTLYHTTSVNVKNCDFTLVRSDEITRKILYQNGAVID